MLDLLREQEKTSFPSRESSFSGWEQSAVSSNLIATIRVTDNFGNQTNVTSSCSIALQTNLRNGLFVANNPANAVDPDGLWQITIGGGGGYGGYITFGNNGGSGLFDGQWNLGSFVGGGAGLFGGIDMSDSGRKCPSTDLGAQGAFSIGLPLFKGARNIGIGGQGFLGPGDHPPSFGPSYGGPKVQIEPNHPGSFGGGGGVFAGVGGHFTF